MKHQYDLRRHSISQINNRTGVLICQYLSIKRVNVFNTSVNTLSLEWEGHHKEMFISDANPHQKKGVTSIEYLKRQENFFRNLRVNRREAYTNPAWETYTKGKH